MYITVMRLEHSWEGGTVWHVMGRCLHPTLQAERSRVCAILRRYMEEREVEHMPEVWAVVGTALDVDQEGRWNLLTGWEAEEPRLDGRADNPWYGLFSPELQKQLFGKQHDPRCNLEGNLTIIEEVIRELRKLRDGCVMACGEMWSAAYALWCGSDEGLWGAPRASKVVGDRTRRRDWWRLLIFRGRKGGRPGGWLHAPGRCGKRVGSGEAMAETEPTQHKNG